MSVRRGLELWAVRGRHMAGLATAVLALHLWLANSVLPDAFGLGSAKHGLARMEVAFVRELAPATPPALPQPAVRTAASRAAARPAPPASAPAAAEAAGVELAAPPLPTSVEAPPVPSEPVAWLAMTPVTVLPVVVPLRVSVLPVATAVV